MSAAAEFGRRIGNELYKAAFPIYRPLYSVFKRYADRVERQLIASHLAAGSVVADVGANIGIYSQFLAKCVGPAGAVHCFEPCPTNFIRLRGALSRCPNVRLNQLAVSDETGHSLLYISEELNVDHRLYPSEGEARRALCVESIRLDDYFKPGARVDMIKMDVQGFELHALRGANRVLADNPGIILVLEFWPYGLKQAGANWIDLIAALEERDMLIRQVTNDGLIPFPFGAPSEKAGWYVNLVAFRR